MRACAALPAASRARRDSQLAPTSPPPTIHHADPQSDPPLPSPRVRSPPPISLSLSKNPTASCPTRHQTHTHSTPSSCFHLPLLALSACPARCVFVEPQQKAAALAALLPLAAPSPAPPSTRHTQQLSHKRRPVCAALSTHTLLTVPLSLCVSPVRPATPFRSASLAATCPLGAPRVRANSSSSTLSPHATITLPPPSPCPLAVAAALPALTAGRQAAGRAGGRAGGGSPVDVGAVFSLPPLSSPLLCDAR